MSTAKYVDGTNSDQLRNWHVIDGGYFDNSGIFAAVQWLHNVLGTNGRQGIDRYKKIVIIEINAFPSAAGDKAPTTNSCWVNAMLGPAKALLEMRTSSQLSRSDTEIALLMSRFQNVAVGQSNPDQLYNGPIWHVVFRPRAGNPPLSWYLSRKDKAQLREEWDVASDGLEVVKLKALFDE